MAPELAALVEAGRELALEDRYELVHQMLISADGPAQDQGEVDAAWKAAFRRLVDDVESGEVELVNGRETQRLARERIATRRAKHPA